VFIRETLNKAKFSNFSLGGWENDSTAAEIRRRPT
jgi:hypothetical protein